MNRHLSRAFRALILLVIIGATTNGSGLTETKHAALPNGWSLDFMHNAKLPSGFLQFSNPRSDGTKQTGFLINRKDCLLQRKPLLVFVNGSGAQSQFFFMPDGSVGWGIYAAIGPLASDEYHVVTCDKRGIEVGYNGENSSWPLEYHRYATFEDRVAEIRLLIDRLLREPLVDPSRILIIGSSEGADIAAGVAAEDPRITHCAFLAGGGATQLFDFLIFQRKKMGRMNNSPEQIVESLQKIEDEFRKIFADPASDTKMYNGHAYRRWSSFCSHPPLESLLKTKAKLFLAHGTEDENSSIESFDLLLAEMIRHRKTNVLSRRYPGIGHILLRPGPSKPSEDVFNDILKWARE
jgi:dipeptidyl aminopeptidase/acylaminoacyl peptidase